MKSLIPRFTLVLMAIAPIVAAQENTLSKGGGVDELTTTLTNIKPINISGNKSADVTGNTNQVVNTHNAPPAGKTVYSPPRQQDELSQELAKELLDEKRKERQSKTAVYRHAFDSINKFNPNNFSITDAVFIVENAFLDNKILYKDFINALKLRADLVKQILTREHLSPANDLALNYGIQKLYSQSNLYYNPSKHTTANIPPFRYDFNDFQGEQDYTKMFTIKLLTTGAGQCHSMPLLYLMIAEQLKARAWLSLAPQHSFIQFIDTNGNLMNFETSNGNIVSSHWLCGSGYITANAIKEKTYLDTLSQRQLYAQCLGDLLLGYSEKFGYDSFSEQIKQKILQIDPNNMTALMIDAEIKTKIARRKISAVGSPAEDKLFQYPEAYHAYLAMQKAYDKIDALGYQDMPKEMYQKWLQSVEQEKKKQENQTLKADIKKGQEVLQSHPFIYK